MTARPTTTPMSHFRGPSPPRPHTRPAPARRLGTWLAACITLLSTGCFYFLPLIPVEKNVPPEIVRASPTPNTPVVIDDRGAVVYLVVADQDDAEALSFIWELTGEGILSGAQTIPDGATRRASQIRLPTEARFDGATLTVTATDGGDSQVTASWPVIVEEGATQ